MRPPVLPVLLFALMGVLAGIGITTFIYAEGFSYLGSDPAVCVNCHIMQPQYDSWQKASHHAVAGCADCHLPVEFPAKYISKIENGWNHSKAFTLQNFHEPIIMTEKNAAILQANCLRCHEDIVQNLTFTHREGAPRCVRCHPTVGHGEPLGLGGPLKIEEERER